ncbi:MAG: YlxR family protein [Nocardiopsaceae bacterium]|nr:YlxR family protein [Nocardiopsaceae bacterium]
MCVGCRSRAAQSDLVRLVVDSGAVTPDTTGRMPGRGAYLHADPRCWESAQRRRVWPRAFRSAGGLDTSRVAAYVAAASRVGVARGSG